MLIVQLMIHYILLKIISMHHKLFLTPQGFVRKKVKLFHISTDEVYGSINQEHLKKMIITTFFSIFTSKGNTDLIAMCLMNFYKYKIINLTNNYGPINIRKFATLIFHF